MEQIHLVGNCNFTPDIFRISYNPHSLPPDPSFHYLESPVIRVTGVDVPMPYAQSLEEACLPQVKDVVAAVKKSLKIQ